MEAATCCPRRFESLVFGRWCCLGLGHSRSSFGLGRCLGIGTACFSLGRSGTFSGRPLGGSPRFLDGLGAIGSSLCSRCRLASVGDTCGTRLRAAAWLARSGCPGFRLGSGGLGIIRCNSCAGIVGHCRSGLSRCTWLSGRRFTLVRRWRRALLRRCRCTRGCSGRRRRMIGNSRS